MNKLNNQNGEFGDTPPIKNELDTPLFNCQAMNAQQLITQINQLTNIADEIEIPDSIRGPERWIACFQYHYQVPVISVFAHGNHAQSTDFQITETGLKLRDSHYLADTEAAKEFALKVLQLPAFPQKESAA